MSAPRKRPAKRRASGPVVKPRGVGRPREESARRRVLSVRVTDTEIGMYTAVAELSGMSIGDWAREILRRACV